MKHYHGGPITPDTCAYRAWRSRHAFVSFAYPQQMNIAVAVTQSFALDNGAFPLWKSGRSIDWDKFFRWVEKWRRHPRFDFAVVPDVIDGSAAENDALLSSWPFPRHEAAAVWHSNESIDRLVRLANEWPLVAIGSSGEFDVRQPAKLLARMREVLPHIVDDQGFPICKLHGLRMLNPRVFKHLPLASADSTNVARNIGVDVKWKGTYTPATKEMRVDVLIEKIEQDVSLDRFDPMDHFFA